jgi:hypothetical protein
MNPKNSDFVKSLISDIKAKDIKIIQLEKELDQKNEIIRQLKDLVKGIENK